MLSGVLLGGLAFLCVPLLRDLDNKELARVLLSELHSAGEIALAWRFMPGAFSNAIPFKFLPRCPACVTSGTFVMNRQPRSHSSP